MFMNMGHSVTQPELTKVAKFIHATLPKEFEQKQQQNDNEEEKKEEDENDGN